MTYKFWVQDIDQEEITVVQNDHRKVRELNPKTCEFNLIAWTGTLWKRINGRKFPEMKLS